MVRSGATLSLLSSGCAGTKAPALMRPILDHSQEPARTRQVSSRAAWPPPQKAAPKYNGPGTMECRIRGQGRSRTSLCFAAPAHPCALPSTGTPASEIAGDRPSGRPASDKHRLAGAPCAPDVYRSPPTPQVYPVTDPENRKRICLWGRACPRMRRERRTRRSDRIHG